MPLIALVSFAWADRVVWASAPTPEQEAEAARRFPGAAAVPLGQLGAPDAPSPAPDVAIAQLRSELLAAIPRFAEFDGELRIMGRLQKAIADVHEVRSHEELALVVRAMVVQGYAVRRYYQDQLATDPAAAAYRSPAGNPTSWEHAVALGAGSEFPVDDITQAAERLAFDAVRAAVLARPAASVTLHPRAKNVVFEVDGAAVQGDAPMVVTPGRHFVRAVEDGHEVAWADPVVGPGESFVLPAGVGPAERAGFAAAAAPGRPIPAELRLVLQGQPTWLAIPGRSTTFFRVDQGAYEAVEAPHARVGIEVNAAAGAGWVSTGDFYRLHWREGAPASVDTVNAATPAVSIGAALRRGPLAFGVGADVQYALGEWHSVPTGEVDTRSFTWVHADAGTEWLRLSAGPLFPWHVGVGLQARLPVWKGLGPAAAVAYGVPLSLTKTDGTAFDAWPTWSAWGGVGYTLR